MPLRTGSEAERLGVSHGGGVAGGLATASTFSFFGGSATQLANPTTLTAFNKTYTLPASSIAIGRMLRINAWGVMNITAAAGSRFSSSIRLGSAILFSGGGGAAPILSTGAYFWRIATVVVFRVIGAAAIGGTSGEQDVCQSSLSNVFSCAFSDNFGPVDATGALVLDVRVALPTSDVNNTVDLFGFTVETAQAAVVSL